MTKSFKYLTALTLIACGCFWAISANANVCFLPRGNCADSEVAGADVDVDDLASKCAADGYIVAKSACVSPQKIGAFCPYDNNWVMCCTPDYTLQCESTNIVVDICGTLVKCGCAEEYDYNENNTGCARYSTGTEYQNSQGDYDNGICYLPTYVNNQLNTVPLYTGCICDDTVYPRTDSICAARNMVGGGTMCQDSNGKKHYTKCLCTSTILKSSCTYGVPPTAQICTSEEGVQYTSACCSCSSSTYPYTEIPPEVDTYTACRAAQGCIGGSSNRYKAETCKPGYEVRNGKCEQVSCLNALKTYLKYNPNTAYGLLTSSGVVDADGNTSNATKAIVADDVTISTASTNSSSTNTGSTRMCRQRTCVSPQTIPYYEDTENCTCTNCCLENHMNADALEMCNYYLPCDYNRIYPNSAYDTVCPRDFYGRSMTAKCTDVVTVSNSSTSTTYKGLANSKATQYISATQFLNSVVNNDPAAATARTVCKNTPTITYTASNFPANDSESASNQTISFSNVNLKFSSTTKSYRKLVLNEGGLNITGTLNAYGPINLSSPSSNGNVNISGTLQIMDTFDSSGYSYNESSSYSSGTINILIPEKYRNRTPASFSFGPRQEFRVSTLAISSATDQYRSSHPSITTDIVGQSLPLAYPYYTTVDFEGPSSSNTANIYTNLYLGYIPGKTLRTSFLTLRMSGNLDWNLYGNSRNYYINLTTGSKIYSTDYGYGNYARIWAGYNTSYGWCKMTDTVYFGRDRHRFLDCQADSCITSSGDNSPLGLSSYYACSIGSSGYVSRESSSSTVTVKPDGDCVNIKTTFGSGCSFSYSRGHDEDYFGPKTGVMLTCEDSEYE